MSRRQPNYCYSAVLHRCAVAPALEHRCVVIRRDLDLAQKCEPARLHGSDRFLRCYPQFCCRAARFTQNSRLVPCSSMPVQDGKQPAGLENIMDGACEAWLV